jgi:hypothetical protein
MVPNVNAGQSSDMHGRIGRIIVRNVSEGRLRTAFPDCGVLAVGADFQITVQLRDLADVYPLLDRVREAGASLVSLSITELS